MSTPTPIAAPVRHPPLPGGLYAICDDSVRPELSVVEKAEALLQGGVRVMQLRLKRLPPALAISLARQVSARCHRQGALCLVNDRVDYALLSQSDGVHLGEDDLPVADARGLLGWRFMIGATVRNMEMIQNAKRDGADYVGLGPIFSTVTKALGVAPLGLRQLQKIAAESPLPVVAISGIGRKNIAQVAATGAHAAAVLSDLLMADSIASCARELEEQFAKGRRC